MKRSILILIGVSVLLMHACSTNVTEQSKICIKPGDLLTITAYSDNAAQTKTSLVDNGNGGKAVEWKTGNSISLFFNQGTNGGDKFTTATNGPIAEFSGKISAVSGSLSGLGGKAYFWGVYPYNALNACDGTTITTSLSASQKAYAGDVADNLLVTVGRSENLSIYFKNTCAVIGFKLSQENIKKVVFSGRANESVAGEFSVSFDSGNNLVVEPTANAVTSISITPAESTTFATGTTYYFATLPDTFSDGYTLTFIRDDGAEATYERTTSFTFAMSTFYTMTNKDSGLTFSDPAPSADNIVFADEKIKAKLVAAFDTNDDGEISYAEAAAVTSIEGVFGAIKTYKSFDEFQYFTGVTSVPSYIFQDSKLQTITFPVSVEEIGYSAFSNCTSLVSATYATTPPKVTIRSGAFSGCSSLSTTFFSDTPDTMLRADIEIYAFRECTSLTNVVLPNEGKLSAAFMGCSNLQSIVLPESILNSTTKGNLIYSDTFLDCSSLQSIVIPPGVNRIEARAFKGCSQLSAVSFSDESLNFIDQSAFENCAALTAIDIPKNVTTIGENAFKGCSNLSVLNIQDNSEIKSCRIGDYAFSECSQLASVIIPNKISYVGECAFSNCTSLTSVVLSERIKVLNSCFKDCISLSSIVLPEGLSTIYDAFEGCTSLVSIVLPESITKLNGTFKGCSSLVSILIPDNTTNIDNAFEECISLTNVVLPESITSIGSRAFYGCCSLSTIIIPESVTSIGQDAFSYCSGLTSVTIPESVTSIGQEAFSYCSGLTSVTIPESVTSIGQSAFSYCSGLISITIPESVTRIEQSTFYGCNGLTSVTIPQSVTSIMRFAFYDCSGLTSITIPESVTRIEDRAFYGCNGLTSLTLLSATPPTVSYQTFEGSYPIYVPAQSVEAYKAASGYWSNYVGRIQPIS